MYCANKRVDANPGGGMKHQIVFSLEYTGGTSDQHLIDFYDVSQALLGFERSLALTTHLVLNNEIITHAPALKGARIFALPPEEGSWKITAAIALAVSGGAYHLGTAKQDTPIGHLVYSLYDYVVSESLGVHVDYKKSLGQLYEESKRKKQELPTIRESQADSLIEKCSTAIREMHRPIYKSETAKLGQIYGGIGGKKLPLNTDLSISTYEYIHETFASEEEEEFEGRITSYNSNTFKGRIYVPALQRPISFELTPPARTKAAIRLITSSLRASALRDHDDNRLNIRVKAYRNTSKSGHLKSLTITQVMT
jgi:hypothetical protein